MSHMNKERTAKILVFQQLDVAQSSLLNIDGDGVTGFIDEIDVERVCSRGVTLLPVDFDAG